MLQVGLFLSLVTFHRRLFLLCILVATLADPLAAIGGQLLGGPRLMRKATLSGSGTCCLVATLLTLAVAVEQQLTADLLAVGLLGGLCATVCEMAGGVAPRYVDDNLLTSYGTGLLLLLAASTARLLGREALIFEPFELISGWSSPALARLTS